MKRAITVVCALLVFGAVLKMKNTATANLGVGYAYLWGSDTGTTLATGGAGAVAGGAAAGAIILTAVQGGATVGTLGGPIGVGAGIVVGGL